jgi:hypothetical protein
MSLLDSLLLEPYRVNVWVAARTDGVAGSGTLSDPYDGSTLQYEGFAEAISEIVSDDLPVVAKKGQLCPTISEMMFGNRSNCVKQRRDARRCLM